jgi:hypothetical protein
MADAGYHNQDSVSVILSPVLIIGNAIDLGGFADNQKRRQVRVC